MIDLKQYAFKCSFTKFRLQFDLQASCDVEKNERRATKGGYFSLVYEAEEAGARKPVFPIHGRRPLLLRISSLGPQPRPLQQLEVRNGIPTDATTVSTTPCKRPLLLQPRELM